MTRAADIDTAIAGAVAYLTEHPDETAYTDREVVDWAVAHCPVSDAITRAVPVAVEVSIG